MTFPVQQGCPKCSSESISAVPLSTRGQLWTWTSQEFRPKTPPYAGPGDDVAFEPFFVGYVELPEQLRIEARLTGITARLPVIGEEMELTIIPFVDTPEGDQLVTFAFQPIATETGSST